MSDAAVVVVHRKRRNTELVLIGFAVILGLGAWLIVNLNIYGGLPKTWPIVVVLWVGLGIALNVIMRWRLPYADPVLLPCVLLLNGLGLTMIFRIDQISSPIAHGANTQMLWTMLGVVLMVAMIFAFRDYRILQRRTYTLGLVGLILLLLPLAPGLGIEEYGSRIWIHLAGFSFQPAEVAKIALAGAFAGYLVDKRDVLALAGYQVLGLDLPRARDLGPIALMWGASLAVLVFEKDLGTSLLFFGLFVMMLYVATERPGWAVLGSLMFAAGAYAGYLLFGHVRVRVSAWLHPFSNFDANFQIIQAQYGFAWGGLLGRGLGEGRPGLTPLARSDFIAGAIGEELGVVGLIAIVMLYGLIVARGLRTGLAGRDTFGKLLATGLSFTFALQVFAIIGGVTRLLPLTGLTTPFMSQGGSSMIANWVIIGLLLIISNSVRRPAPVITAEAEDDTTQLITVPAESRTQ
ncbi:MAG: FtsW/RodA/SpoVE family cell cycle protein [Propionibacteriaceae bacterium]